MKNIDEIQVSIKPYFIQQMIKIAKCKTSNEKRKKQDYLDDSSNHAYNDGFDDGQIMFSRLTLNNMGVEYAN
jgi:hypothetical protein